MKHLRTSIRDHRRLAFALIVLAFCIKAIIPAGFMVSNPSGLTLTISVCSESTGSIEAMAVTIPAKDGGAKHSADAKDGHCAFAGLGHLAVGGADPILLAVAFAFILVLGLAPAPRAPFRRIAHFMPPLRGPPAAA